MQNGKRTFLEHRRAAGRAEPIAEWPLTRDVIIADTDRAARDLAERHIMVAYRKEYAGGWRHPFIDASIATDLDKLMKDRFIIGRGKQSSDLTIKDPNVSRQHAMIEFLNGQYYIVDMGSTNGVEYNGQRVQRRVINDGDMFRVCDHELRFALH